MINLSKQASLEDREVTISRAKFTVTYPSSFMLVASMNPSPSGYFNRGSTTPVETQRYLSKISGTLLDRTDLHIEVPVFKTLKVFITMHN